MAWIIVGIYLLLIGAIGLFGIQIDPKIPSLFAFIAGLAIVVLGALPYVRREP